MGDLAIRFVRDGIGPKQVTFQNDELEDAIISPEKMLIRDDDIYIAVRVGIDGVERLGRVRGNMGGETLALELPSIDPLEFEENLTDEDTFDEMFQDDSLFEPHATIIDFRSLLP